MLKITKDIEYCYEYLQFASCKSPVIVQINPKSIVINKRMSYDHPTPISISFNSDLEFLLKTYIKTYS